MIRTLLLLGATGDLARRFLFPALGALEEARQLPEGFRVVGAARESLDTEGVRRLSAGHVPERALTYRTVDLADPSSVAGALDGISEAVVVYLALPPSVFASTIVSLGAAGLPRGSRIAVEKPFGDDVASAHALNTLLAQTDADAYRVDHVLGMETTQNLVAMRRRNPGLERLWNGESVERVEVLWEETLALEGRAEYYDRAGALKDVLQSHMLQLLALVCMKPPADDAELHACKLDTLRSVRVATASRRGRYTAGTLADGRSVGAYADEDGVDPARHTETFAELVLELDDARWSGTRFVLRAGKALARRRKLVLLRFRGGGSFRIGIDGPEDLSLRLAGRADSQLELRAPPLRERLPAYAHVLLDLLQGSTAFTVGAREAELAWQVVAPVLAAWESGDVILEEYAAGSAGPS